MTTTCPTRPYGWGAVPEAHVRLDDRLGWQTVELDSVEFNPGGCGVRLVRLPGTQRALIDAAGSFAGLAEPTGVAVDPWGRIYVADRHDDRVKRFDPCGDGFAALVCFGGTGSAPRRLREPRGIAAGCDGLVAIVDGGNRRVQVIDGSSLTLMAVIGPLGADGCPVAVGADGAFAIGTWDPVDVVATRAGRLLVSDRANGLIHRFDRDGRRHGAISATADGTPLAAPTHLALDRCDRLYVVQDGRATVEIYGADGTPLGVAPPPDALARRFQPGPVATDADGNLYIAESATGTLWRYGCYDTCAVPGTPVQFTGASCDTGGVVDGFAFTADGDPLIVSGPAGAAVSLSGPCTYAPEGRLVSGPLDSGVAGCCWDRVVLDGCVPDATTVLVQTYTDDQPLDAEDLAAVTDDRWSPTCAWSGPGESPWDALVLSGPGRYLWLRLVLLGTRRSSPHIEAVRAVFPRSTSAEHLPAVFRSGPDGGDFIERLMALLDATTATVDNALDALPALFDPMATPAGPDRDALAWLASWLGLALEPVWSESVRRSLVAHASYLFAYRGTPAALRAALRIVLGLSPGPDAHLVDCDRHWPEPATACSCATAADALPTVFESFKLRRWLFLGGSRVGSDTQLWGKRITDRLQVGQHSTLGTFAITDLPDPVRDPFLIYAHRATVFFPAAGARDDGTRRVVENLAEMFTPAHVRTTVEFVEPHFLVGVQATVGLDTVVGRYPGPTVLGAGALGSDTVLQDDPSTPARPGFQIARDAQLGSSVL
jgi:phage tail-like protein